MLRVETLSAAPTSLLPRSLQAQGKAAPPNAPRSLEPPGRGWLTGMTRSRQILKFFLWLGFSFLRENLVSPINSLWPNLSSSQTEILQAEAGGGGGGEKEEQMLLLCTEPSARWFSCRLYCCVTCKQ